MAIRFVALILFAALAPFALCQKSIEKDKTTEATPGGYKRVISLTKTIRGGPVFLCLDMRPKKIIEVSVSTDRKGVRYAEFNVVPRDKKGEILPISAAFPERTHFLELSGPGDRVDALGSYTMEDHDVARLFSVDVTFRGQTQSFRLHAPLP